MNLGTNAGPDGVAYDGSRIWVASFNTSTVTRIDASTMNVTGTVQLPANSGPIGVAYDGTNVWVANFNSNSVSRIDPDSATVTATVQLPANSGPTGVATDGANVWVTDHNTDRVSRIDPANANVSATVSPAARHRTAGPRVRRREHLGRGERVEHRHAHRSERGGGQRDGDAARRVVALRRRV